MTNVNILNTVTQHGVCAALTWFLSVCLCLLSLLVSCSCCSEAKSGSHKSSLLPPDKDTNTNSECPGTFLYHLHHQLASFST